MDSSAGAWNLNCLQSLLKEALRERVKGVTEPYCYIGCWKAFFSWHKEDLDLGAINYIHEGASKFWYAIAPEHAHLLEEEAAAVFKTSYRQCPEFLRHKTFLINPQALLNKHPNLKISKIEHKAGEIMMVFGGAYHEGFNLGFNIAEAVNYGTRSWIDVLPQVRFCKCFRKCVRGEVESILYNLEHSNLYQELRETPSFQKLQLYVLENQLNEQQNYEIELAEGTGAEVEAPQIIEEAPEDKENEKSQQQVPKIGKKIVKEEKVKKCVKGKGKGRKVQMRSGEDCEWVLGRS